MVLIWWFISDFFGFIFDAIQTIVSWLTSMFSIIGSCLNFLSDLIESLPTVLTVSFIGITAVAVLYKFLGREGQD